MQIFEHYDDSEQRENIVKRLIRAGVGINQANVAVGISESVHMTEDGKRIYIRTHDGHMFPVVNLTDLYWIVEIGKRNHNFISLLDALNLIAEIAEEHPAGDFQQFVEDAKTKAVAFHPTGETRITYSGAITGNIERFYNLRIDGKRTDIRLVGVWVAR